MHPLAQTPSNPPSAPTEAEPPVCPRCGKTMHVYARENGIVRFRCAAYPACRTYAKSAIEEPPVA